MTERASLTLKGDGKANLVATVNRKANLTVGQARGTSYYPALIDKPSIEGHELVGDSTLPQIGVFDITPQQIDQIIYG